MKTRVFATAILAAFMSAFPALQAQAPTVTGYLVDVSCGADKDNLKDDAFSKRHAKNCLLMNDCIKTGFGVLTAERTLVKFDAKGNAEALKLIRGSQKTNDWKVTVAGKVQGETISVESLALAK